MRRITTRLAATAALALALGACSDEATGPTVRPPGQAPNLAKNVIPDRYIVVFRESVSDAPGLAKQLALAHGGTLHHTYRHALRGFAATLNAQAAEALRKNPNVAYVEADQMTQPAQISAWAYSWGVDRIDQRGLPLNNYYTYGRTGQGVTVYVIDTGIQTGHAEFGGRAWGAYDAFGGGGQDCNGHGTHVAGTIGGATYGVARGVSLAAVRVYPCSGGSPWSTVIAGIDWVRYYHTRPAVANLSLTGGALQAADDAVNSLIAAGVTVVASAGNDAYDACYYSPARVPGALTVGATDVYDQQAWFSNGGSCLDLYAPGEGIVSAQLNGGAATRNGSSMATAHVSGAAALYLQGSTAAAPYTVHNAIVSHASTGQVQNLGWESPDRLLYADFGVITGPVRVPVHRIYSSYSGDHMYGFDAFEQPDWSYSLEYQNYFYVPTQGLSSHQPLYRCWNPNVSYTGDRFLTTDANCENSMYVQPYPSYPQPTYEEQLRPPPIIDEPCCVLEPEPVYTNWYEGQVGWVATTQVPGSVPLYRLYNPGLGDTFHTIDANEANYAVANYGYTMWGISGYVYLTP